MFIKYYIKLFRLLIIYLSGQIQDSLPGKICLGVVGTARALVIGKIVGRIKGVFTVIVPLGFDLNAAKMNHLENTIIGDLHDGGKHYHVWEDIPNGDKGIYAKFTHVPTNPNTGQTNVPIHEYLSNEDPQSRGILDGKTYVDHTRNIVVDANLIQEKITEPNEQFKMNFIPDPNQSKLSPQLREAIYTGQHRAK